MCRLKYVATYWNLSKSGYWPQQTIIYEVKFPHIVATIWFILGFCTTLSGDYIREFRPSTPFQENGMNSFVLKARHVKKLKDFFLNNPLTEEYSHKVNEKT